MTRSLEPELMDSPGVSGDVLEKFHKDLNRVNRLLGTFPTIERFLRKDDQPIRSILDIGCGGGALLEFLRRRMGVDVVGVDLKPGENRSVPILVADAVNDRLPSADVAVCSLLAHHLSPEQIVGLIQNVSRSCRRFVISDLVRHPMPLILFSVFICPLIGHEAAVDGRQSVRRAYTPEEFRDLAATALKKTGGSFTTDVSPVKSRQIIDIRFR